MNKFIYILAIILALTTNCANKKKKALLFPFFAILDEQSVSPPATSAGSETSTYQVPPAPSTLTNSNSETYQVQPEQSNNYLVVPASSSATTETSNVKETSSENSSISSTTDSSTAATDSSTSTTGVDESKPEKELSEPSKAELPNLSQQNLSAHVEVATKQDSFKFQTTKSYNLNTKVVDSSQTLIAGALVSIYELEPQTGETKLIFQQVTSSEGKIQGSILVNQATEKVEATVTIGNQTSQGVPIPLLVAVQQSDGSTVNLPISNIAQIDVPVKISIPSQIADRDNDGVPDANDFYPDDPTKATKLRFPSEGFFTVSYEDLFPSAGDADLNDYVVQVSNEEDLDAQGRVVEIRGEYQHVARGAGYRHSLFLKLPSEYKICLNDKDKGHGNNSTGVDLDNPGKSTGINRNALENRKASFETKCSREDKVSLDVSFESVIYDAAGNDTRTGKVRYNPSLEEIQDGFDILGDSGKTISSSNVDPTKPYKPGHRAVVTIKFNKPVPKVQLGSAPYDLFIRILSKKIDSRYPASAPRAMNVAQQFYEVHFPNFYFDSNGKDIYMDSKGFPWAILVPKVWAWPLEGGIYDIRGSKSAYPKFKLWMESNGQLEKDWYNYPEAKYVYPLPESSSLTAFLGKLNSLNFLLGFAIASLAVLALLLRRRKSVSAN